MCANTCCASHCHGIYICTSLCVLVCVCSLGPRLCGPHWLWFLAFLPFVCVWCVCAVVGPCLYASYVVPQCKAAHFVRGCTLNGHVESKALDFGIMC